MPLTPSGSRFDSNHAAPCFLPDFCRTHVIFGVVVMAELLAFILALISAPSPEGIWKKLGLISLFIQWIALGNVLLLCLGRGWLQGLTPFPAAIVSYGISLLVTLLVSAAALHLIPAEALSLAQNGYGPRDFIIRNLAISAIVSAVALRYFYVQHQWKSNIETEAHARIQALQARIRPHFLFNSMNTIASLTRTHPELAEKAVEDLADLFRASLGQKDKVSLGEELEFTRRYINIEQLRLGDRLTVAWRIEDGVTEQAPVPALLLQPLVENAIYHGIEPQPGGGTVTISIRQTDHALSFEISNPLPKAMTSYRRTGNKMAQDNIRQRLKLAYGDTASLHIHKTDAQYIVHFTIPIENSYEDTRGR